MSEKRIFEVCVTAINTTIYHKRYLIKSNNEEEARQIAEKMSTDLEGFDEIFQDTTIDDISVCEYNQDEK